MPAPLHILTERLRLRPFEPRDTDALHGLWTLPEVRRYLWDDIAIEREVAAEVVAASAALFASKGYGLFVIHESGRRHRSGQADPPGRDPLVGFCGLRDYADPGSGGSVRPEVLYGLDPAHWRRGVAREAAVAVLRFGFEACALERIDGGVDPPNERSRRVLEGLGFGNWRRIELGGLPADFAELRPEAFFASDAANAAYECVPAAP